MRHKLPFSIPLLFVLGIAGCKYDRILTPNMQQATYRSAGDLAMTALLDAGIEKADAEKYANGVIAFFARGAVTKGALRDAIYEAVPSGKMQEFAPYIDAILLVVPANVQANQQIPREIRIALISFLKDGALRATELYSGS